MSHNINNFIYSDSDLDEDILKALKEIGPTGDAEISFQQGSIVPDSDAVDYADEMDLVDTDDEDEEDSALEQKPKPSSTTDVDNMVDNLLENVLKKHAPSMGSVEPMSKAPTLVNADRSDEKSREIDERIRKLDQFKDIGTDKILRFSDIFISKIPKDKAISLVPIPNWKDLDEKNIKESIRKVKPSISDQEIFDELPRSENFHSETETATLERDITPVYHSSEERTIPFGFSILDKADDEASDSSQNTQPYDDTDYAIVQHYPWEKEIIWTPEVDGMEVEEEEEKTTNGKDEDISYSIFPPTNKNLQWGEWDKTIIWDDEDPSQKKRYIRENRQIEVEMSDINMLFEGKESSDYKDDETEETDKSGETVKKKPRRRHLQLPSRVANASELILRNKQEALKQVDRFNLSNDKYYLEGKQALAQVQESTSVQHSLYALKYVLMKASLTTEELRNFHKPRFPLKKKFLYTIRSPYKRKEKRKAVLSVDIMKSKKDLSARDGRVILTEYIEEYPPLLLKIGMGSKIRNYYRKKSEEENKPSLTFQDGENVYLEPKDEPPFLGDIKPGTQLQSFENNLFKSPIFRHQPEETDFLLIKKGDKIYVREIQTIYTVGQEQPLMEVPAPNSRQSNKFIKDRLKQYIHYMFRQKKLEVERNAKNKGGKEIPSLKISEVSKAFPGQSDNSIRKQLKECSEYQRGGDDSQSWVLKPDFTLPDENTIRNYVTLDEVCSYESMLACAQRLQDMGIERLNNPSVHIHLAAASLPEPRRSIAKFIAQELELTTWNLSSNFFNATQNGKGILRLTGFGGPLRDGEAFSYLRLPQKIPNLKAEKEKEAKQQVSGTDRDLRKLTLPEATEILLQHGLSEEYINSLPRWKRIGKVRELANKAKFSSDQVSEDDTVKFARGSRHNVATHQQAYNDKCQTIFENHIRIISDPNPPKDPDDVEYDDEIGSLLEELDMSNSVGSEKTKSDEDYEQELYEKYFRSLDTEMSSQNKESESDVEESTSTKTKKTTEKVITTVVESEVDLGGFTPETVPRTPTGQPAPYGYLKRSFTRPDDTTVVEYITDPKTIEAYKQKMEKKAKTVTKRVCRPVQEDEDQKLEKQKQKREKRRIQEKRRREKKNADKQRVLQERLESGNLNGALEGEGKNKLKCGRCGMIGHMRTNRICPMFDENEELNITRRRRKKRGRDDPDSDDDDSIAEEQYIKSRRKIKKRSRLGKDSPQGILAEALRAIWEKVESNPLYYPFRYKVDKKEAPDYYDIVENPIHMGNIRDKLDRHDYDSVQEFLDDWNLMKSNCYEYNEFRNPHLLPIADKMLEEVQDLIKQNQERLNLIEQKIAASNDFSHI